LIWSLRVAAKRVHRGIGLACVVAACIVRPALAQQIDAPAENRYAAWRSAPFTCSDLVEADANKTNSTDATENYNAIVDWETEFPKLAERRDRQTISDLKEAVLKWCSDPNVPASGSTALADVVEKVWRLMGY